MIGLIEHFPLVLDGIPQVFGAIEKVESGSSLSCPRLQATTESGTVSWTVFLAVPLPQLLQ